MRTAVRHRAIWTVLAAYAVLWTGGAAWHGILHNGPGRHAAAPQRCGASPLSHGGSPCCAGPGADQDESNADRQPLHDADDCQVCRWYQQSHRPAEFVFIASEVPLPIALALVAVPSSEQHPEHLYSARAPPV